MDTTLSAPVGQLLDGRYLVESQLARGGMATVYVARDVRLDRAVALKIAHPELARDSEFVARFISEARSVAKLSSPNVVAVFDQGSTGDLNYIAMEYVPGPTLRELLNARGRLAPREALDIIERVLAGLAAAHDAGIIHRDVKPENVLLGNGTSVKVADFGLARAADGVSHTRTGLLIGTAAYLAPEQVASNSSDERTDVYASGVLLFEMLTGVQPHTGESPLSVAYKHVNEVVPAPSTLTPGLPAALDTLVALGTSRDPDLRPPDARHYLRAITEVRRGMPLPPVPPRNRRADGPAVNGHRQPGPGSGPEAGPAGYPAATGLAALGLAGADTAGSETPAVTTSMPGTRAADQPTAALSPARTGPGSGGHDRTGPLPVFGESDRTDGFGSGGRGQANHTMIVPAGGPGLEYADSGGYPARRPRRAGRDGEPLLQRWLFSRRILIILAVIVLAVAGWWVIDGRYVTVPSVAQQSATVARATLTDAGLKVSYGAARHSYTVPAGDVISTSPAGGARIGRGGTVRLTDSLGPVTVSMPAVTGQPLAQAEAALKSAGLTVSQPVSYQTSTTIPAGVVISTTPFAYKTWPANKPVQLVVSAGPPLPSFVGQPVTTAQQAAAAGGYSIQQQTLSSNPDPAGTVVRQSPAAGSRITAGMVVTVYVSPGPAEVNVPDVEGMSRQQAVQALQAAGFQVTVNDSGLGNKVTGYDPTGQAPQGSTITVNIGFTF